MNPTRGVHREASKCLYIRSGVILCASILHYVLVAFRRLLYRFFTRSKVTFFSLYSWSERAQYQGTFAVKEFTQVW